MGLRERFLLTGHDSYDADDVAVGSRGLGVEGVVW